MNEYFVEEKSTYDKTLDLLVFLAVFVVTIFLILDVFSWQEGIGIDPQELAQIYFPISFVVLAIFVLDLIRLWKESQGPKDFFQHSWLDILATIPFELIAWALMQIPPGTVAAFGILKWFRFARIGRAAGIARAARVSKVSRQFKAASHLKKESEEYKRKNRL